MAWTAAIALLAVAGSGVPAPKYGIWECHMQSMMRCPRDGGCSEVPVEPGFLRLDVAMGPEKALYSHCSEGKAGDDCTVESATVSSQPSVMVFHIASGLWWARLARDWTVTEMVNYPDLTLIAFGKCQSGPAIVHAEVP